MASVKLRNIRKSYGKMEVIPDLNLDIEDGEFVILVGPSGCGKSTLLRMIAGLESITDGDLHIGERLVNEVAPSDRDIAMVFQNYALYPHKTVAQNMGFSLKIKGVSKDEIDRRVAGAAEILGLTPYLDRVPRALSGGQRQRVAMGRAIVRDPSVFLFDEPLSNLDAKLRVKMRTEIRELHRRLQTTTIYVTHDQIEAMTMADRIVLLQAGKIEQVGTPLELYDRPANTFVAGFIGSPAINLIDAEYGAALTTSAGEIAAPAGYAELAGQRVIVGIRPEHLRPAATGLRAIVHEIEPTGAESHVVFETAAGRLVTVLPGRSGLTRGQELCLGCDADRLHLFDQSTGRRIAPMKELADA